MAGDVRAPIGRTRAPRLERLTNTYRSTSTEPALSAVAGPNEDWLLMFAHLLRDARYGSAN